MLFLFHPRFGSGEPVIVVGGSTRDDGDAYHENDYRKRKRTGVSGSPNFNITITPKRFVKKDFEKLEKELPEEVNLYLDSVAQEYREKTRQELYNKILNELKDELSIQIQQELSDQARKELIARTRQEEILNLFKEHQKNLEDELITFVLLLDEE